MCDTLVKFIPGKRQSFFAKNSDRHPKEPQYLQYITPQNIEPERFIIEERKHYIKHQLPALKKALAEFSPRFDAIISKPSWIWGAEMGVNEKGVAIGNEAVFSAEKLEKNGLLGMDILRLALQYAENARQALDTVISLIEKYGQGGNGAYRGRLEYHNSFLIKDFNEAYILETAGRFWVYKKITDYASISNTYTITGDFDKSNSKALNFKQEYETKIYNFLSKGPQRLSLTRQSCQRIETLFDTFEALRNHGTPNNYPKRGMDAVCMHSGLLIKSETTASMVVHYINDRFIVWATNSPHPCVSKFFPIIFTEKTAEILQPEFTYELFFFNRRLAKARVKNYKQFLAEEKSIINHFEQECYELILNNIDTPGKLQEISHICLPKPRN